MEIPQTMADVMTDFSYTEMTKRNIGFVTEAEQAKLQGATVFVCGTGGMGGACILGLVRAGIGRLIIADIDTFEVSNLNRQVFAFAETVDLHKAEATRKICLSINPDLEIEVLKDDWPAQVSRCVATSAVVVNGTDDLGAALLLYRTAKNHNKTVIDAYASPLPSIFVTKPQDPTPEERLDYPTINTAWDALTPAMRADAFAREAEYVVIHSSSRHHIDLAMVGEVVAGKRSRMSFAPMVITTGMLMSTEVINAVLGRPHGADFRGWFFNPAKARVERPRSALVAAILRPIVRRFLAKLSGEAA